MEWMEPRGGSQAEEGNFLDQKHPQKLQETISEQYQAKRNEESYNEEAVHKEENERR